MIIENINHETVIRLPETVKFNYLQKFIDYITVKSIVSKSEATDQEVDQLSEEVQSKWWNENKHRFIK